MTRSFKTALVLNFIWINLSEVWRYFVIVKPALHEALPDATNIAPVTPAIFISWMVWDTILICAATGFYWLYFKQLGRHSAHILWASLAFTITVFGLLWLGVINMGLVPSHVAITAMPLAWIEQAVAAYIVYRFAFQSAVTVPSDTS